jgi:CMP-2-keto-3-deoxyoctulosonic acid synthetase
VKPLAVTFALAAALGTTPATADELDADTLIRAYDTATAQQKAAIEQTVLTAENAFREANSVIVLQRNELALYCLRANILTGKQLIEMVRVEVGRANFVGKYPFEMSLLHGLQSAFPCPSKSP